MRVFDWIRNGLALFILVLIALPFILVCLLATKSVKDGVRERLLKRLTPTDVAFPTAIVDRHQKIYGFGDNDDESSSVG